MKFSIDPNLKLKLQIRERRSHTVENGRINKAFVMLAAKERLIAWRKLARKQQLEKAIDLEEKGWGMWQ